MKLCQFNDDRLGLIQDGFVHDVSEALDVLPSMRWPLPLGDLLIANLDRVRSRASELVGRFAPLPIFECRLLSPIANPSKIMGAPLNYNDHLEESVTDSARHDHALVTAEEQGLFLKAASALIGPGEAVVPRFPDQRNDHEAELAVVIGRKGKNIAHDQAASYIAGYCIGLDMTLRGPGFQSFRKSIDTYCVLGPWLTTADEIPDWKDIDFELSVNGEVRQKSNTRYMVVGVERLIELASRYYTLYPGDVIMTGTSGGVGPVVPGDRMDVAFAGLGRMRVDVASLE